MRRPIPALTFWRPWPACITALRPDVAKRRENRGWRTSHRGLFWIHAGKRWDPSAFDVADAAERATGGYAASLSRAMDDHPTGVVALAELLGICSASTGADHLVCACGRWAFSGQRHWHIGRVWPLTPPVDCPGSQQLWTLPPDVEAAAVAQMPWCVRILGSDDLIATPDRATAEQLCERLATLDAHSEGRHGDLAIPVAPMVEPWPHGQAAHAAQLAGERSHR